ncbi:MAG: hypothetical protein ACQEXJ_19115 [Myxococcota bacterium]
MTARLPHALAALATLAVSGCLGGGFWQAGLSDGDVPEAAPIANGMAVTLGDAAFDAASLQLTRTLKDSWPDGVLFDGGTSTGGDLAPQLAWEDAELTFGPVDLTVDAAGLGLDISVTMDPVAVAVAGGGQTLCEVFVGFDHGVLKGRLSLTRTKLGRVQGSPESGATFQVPQAWVDASGCPDWLHESWESDDETSDTVQILLDALADQAFEELAPDLAQAVPDALGLDIGAAGEVTWGDDGIGEGSLRAMVRASQAQKAQWWQFVDGRLVAPYAVAIEATRHPCVPDEPLPPAAAVPLPPVERDAALLVHEGVVRRSMAALWRAGGLCGTRTTRTAAAWTVADLAPLWPALAVLEADTPVTVRIWPDAMPEATFRSTAEGVRARVATDLWTVEVMGMVDHAEVRLATLRVALEVDADVVVGGKRAVSLAARDVHVVASGVEPGLLGAPEPGLAEALAIPLTRELIEAAPVAWLPPLPTGGIQRVERQGSYLVFSREPEPVDRERGGP